MAREQQTDEHREQQGIIKRMTNRERTRWARAGCPMSLPTLLSFCKRARDDFEAVKAASRDPLDTPDYLKRRAAKP